VKRPTFAALLLKLMEEKSLSAYRLAADAGLTRQAVAKLLAGSAPSWETVQRIAAALGVSTEALRDR
jgi:transcriptional regulator with XRE-family HTH domain